MKHRHLFLFAAAALLTLFTASTLHAQTNLVVGSNSSGVSSNFTSGTIAYTNIFVGFAGGADSNKLTIVNDGTFLTNRASVYVGNGGSSNLMVIVNGGKLRSIGASYVGFSNTASNNDVLVTMAGSVWTNGASLRVGQEGSGNSLIVSDGGRVANTNSTSTFHIGFTNTASNNSVLVTGTGSILTNRNELRVGNFGSGNSLSVSNGGTVLIVGNTSIGFNSGASSNIVLVTGTDSRWTNSGFLRVGGLTGTNSGWNSLVVSNGGGMEVGGTHEIGGYETSSNNSVLVTGAGSFLNNSSTLSVGLDGDGNSMVISDGGTVSVADITGIGFGDLAANNSVLVTGAGSFLTNSSTLSVGLSGDGNSMIISNGGTVSVAADIEIGSATSSSGNSVLVTGSDSLLTASGDLFVGYEGADNSLTISNGGSVANANGYIGYFPAASNNSVLVTGANSLWTNSGSLTVGDEASESSLTVADGSTVAAASQIFIAKFAGSTGTLNIGSFGGSDAAGTIDASTIAFGDGTGAINFNQSNSTTLSAAISGNGTVNQLGTGTTTLSASNSYTGATTVGGGLLVVNGSIASSAVTVNSGGTLAGSGSVGGLIVNSGGTINPGNSPGTLNINGDIDWLGGGNYNWQIAGVTGTAGTVSTWDLVSATGILDLTALTTGSQFNINLWSLQSTGPDVNGDVTGFNNTQGYTWKIATAAGGIVGFSADKFLINTGVFNGTGGFANALNGGSFSLAQSGNDLNLVFTAAGGPGPSPVPEPGTWAAAALLVGGAAFMRWRKRKQIA